MAAWHELIAHTADAGIRVTADSPEELFEEAARAMFGLMVSGPPGDGSICEDLEIQEEDWAHLVWAWLSELLFLFHTERAVLREFTVRHIGPTRLEATARGDPYDPARHQLETEIKAVTLHQLFVRRKGERWEAQVIFDL